VNLHDVKLLRVTISNDQDQAGVGNDSTQLDGRLRPGHVRLEVLLDAEQQRFSYRTVDRMGCGGAGDLEALPPFLLAGSGFLPSAVICWLVSGHG
jgi:hypothetical protein